MADIEDTPPATQPPPSAHPRVLPVQPTPATHPGHPPRPGRPAPRRPRRWTWLLGGLTAGAGAAAVALTLVANLANPAPTAAPTTAATIPGGPSSSPSSGPAIPTTAPHTTLVDGCALLRPETVERHIKGAATCSTAAKPVGGETSSNGTWTSKDSGYASAMGHVMLSPLAESIYQQMLTISRTAATTTGAKITDDRAVPGLGDKATPCSGPFRRPLCAVAFARPRPTVAGTAPIARPKSGAGT
ncbi:hypothetical protein OTB20_17850 [Streptomyces sp. H27-H1]|uniref:hypothetical protein n=1 Tax=Streptomyces sp. H27-H1 TaxID=2996461 RepID=UPI00226E505E|nr:hypothetical protein [Streptomyces sp. H27-H1]MCY0928026.1 hypothetical protein [Streptomyces sp. H27-H1]